MNDDLFSVRYGDPSARAADPSLMDDSLKLVDVPRRNLDEHNRRQKTNIEEARVELIRRILHILGRYRRSLIMRVYGGFF